MNSRHAAAFALVGWYLITPPLMLESNGVFQFQDGKKLEELAKDPHFAPNPNQPYSKWEIVSSYSDKSQCEEERQRLKQFAETRIAQRRGERERRWGMVMEFDQKFMLAICIASNDPRLKETN